MINLHDFFAVNWIATADNIRGYMRLKNVSVNVLAEAMHTSERTIQNWSKGKTKPSIDELIFLAKFFNVDLLNILVTNSNLEKNISKQDYDYIHNKCLEQDRVKEEEDNYDYKFKEEIYKEIIFNEYVKSTYPITTLNEFLSCLHLFEPILLIDVVRRISGSIGIDNEYVFTQLKYLYDNIKDEKAKKYVEFLKKYYFTYPFINEIDDETKFEFKLKKIEDYYTDSDSDDLNENYESYMKQLNVFIEKINLLDEMKLRFDSLK